MTERWITVAPYGASSLSEDNQSLRRLSQGPHGFREHRTDGFTTSPSDFDRILSVGSGHSLTNISPRTMNINNCNVFFS